MELIKEYAKEIASGQKPSEDEFAKRLAGKVTKAPKAKDADLQAGVLFETSTILAQLIRLKRDTVWTFILKNIYKPLFLRKRRFDAIVGNPPWISYRYIESTDYQKFLKQLILEDYLLLPAAHAELITQLEIATLFFLRSFQLYAKGDGIIAFVMPFSIFVSDQHDKFRSGTYGPVVKITKLVNLEDVEPLFKVRACVAIGTKGKTIYPIPGVKVGGRLPSKNIRLLEAGKLLRFADCEFLLYHVGPRSFVETREFEGVLKAIDSGTRSPYYTKFTQGATIVPSQLWFVEPVVHPALGVDPTAPQLETSTRATERAKEEYADVRLDGRVERQFLFVAATGSELCPFGHLEFPLCILPIEPSGKKFRIVSSQEAGAKGLSHLKKWLQRVESVWSEKRGEKAKKVDVYSWLNWTNKLTDQSSKPGYKVLYNTSGTYLVSCIVRIGPTNARTGEVSLAVSGVVAGHTTYFYDTDSEREAQYLCACLNAPIVDKLIKPMQSRGLWGERHIVKKVLELPIPKFNSQDSTHEELVELALKCQKKVEASLPELAKGLTGIGRIRQLVKDELGTEIEQIDHLVKGILVKQGMSKRGLEGFS